MIKIEIFLGSSCSNIQSKINAFLDKETVEYVDLKLGTGLGQVVCVLVYMEVKLQDINLINKTLSKQMEAKHKAMTEQLRLTHSDEEVGEYIRSIIKSDIAENYWKEKFKNVFSPPNIPNTTNDLKQS